VSGLRFRQRFGWKVLWLCGGCGAPLDVPTGRAGEKCPGPQAAAGAAQPSDGERRQVTVLFADLSGFTRLSSGLGPEDTHALLNRFFAAVDAVVERFGGTVDKHVGDSVMAVFGAPIAHGNDPEHVVRAAIDIHQAVAKVASEGEPLAVHIGVAGGQVVASGTGSAAHQEYRVTGDSVNLASPLQDLAAYGQTLISDAVRGAVSAQIECEDVG
jgi:class 3 adenylate cyclase